ncbi:hypothetical protein H6CHR_05209 [Variovorax sp. PBL-H6]|uniref:hypothetical protein n=1 Tax=Variovorax sp. PBL-H6 TaxID=434009 RepID=UPI001317E0FA|nr:hypothetical protein [Variovorax sp. PBL-H6]VTU38393.1 hypothetical protein H6CHR_05209 [Variovorax sp. PBL-H6]
MRLDEPGHPDPRGESVPLAPDRRGIGGTKKPSRLLELTEQDCPHQWAEVSACLANVKGLQFQGDDKILAISKLDEADLGSVAEAIAILVDANCLKAACTLMGMCKPSALIVLLEPCTLNQVNELKTSNDPAVCKAMDRFLRAAARRAWKDGDFLRCRNLVQFCSPEVKASFIRRSLSLVKEMSRLPVDGDMLVEAVRTALAWVAEFDEDEGLSALGGLLQITNDLGAHELPRSVAMKCLIWPALGRIVFRDANEDVRMERTRRMHKLEAMAWFPALTPELLDAVPVSLQSEVLRVAVEQAVNSQNIVECTDRLRELASLSEKICEPLPEELKSYVRSALTKLSLQWDEEVYKSHQHSLLKVEKKAQRMRRGSFMGSLKAKADRFFRKDSADEGTLVHLAEEFRFAIQEGNLHIAARLIHDSPYPEFGDAAREELFNAVVRKFAEVGLELQQWPFRLGEAEQDDAELAAKQDSVVLETAAALLVTGEPDPYFSLLADRILSEHFATQKRQQAAIQRLIEGLGIGLGTLTIVDVLSGDLVYALPELCSLDHAAALEVILAMEEGKSLLAIAVVDCLLQDDCSDATIALLFKALAHRIDLRAALPPIHTGLVQVDARIVTMPMESPRRKMIKMLRLLQMAKLAGDYAENCGRWAPGWRLLACMHDQPDVFIQGPTMLLAVQAIDAAAADVLHGGAKELLDRLHDKSVELALHAMLEEPPVIGKRLLSGDALVNVMRALVSDGGLGERMFTWSLPGEERAMLHVAAAHALISLMDDVTPCRFNPAKPANHAVARVAHAFSVSLDSNPARIHIQREIGEAALKTIETASHSFRLG